MEFLKTLEKLKKYLELLKLLRNGEKVFIGGGNISSFSFLTSGIFLNLRKPLFIILPDELKAENFYKDIGTFIGEGKSQFLPAPEYFPDGKESFSESMFERVKVFSKLAQRKNPVITVTFPAGIIRKIPSPESFLKANIPVQEGKKLIRNDFLKNIINSGYDEEEIVEFPGEFARRGGIIDIFPPDSDFPLRIELSGNTVNTIRQFEVSSQSSFKKLKEFSFFPVAEHFVEYEFSSTILDFIQNSTIFISEPEKLSETNILRRIQDEGKEKFMTEVELKRLEEDSNIFGEKFESHLRYEPVGVQFIEPSSTGVINVAPTKENSCAFKLQPRERKNVYFKIFPVSERFKIGETTIWDRYPGENLVIFSNNSSNEDRLRDILKEQKIETSLITFSQGVLSSGFSFPEINTSFLSNDEIFSRYKTRHVPLRKIETVPLSSWGELKKGDYVVHYNEGIGKFSGMKNLKVDGQEEEFILLEYTDGDKLYVPINQISFIHKFTGNKNPTLSKLGSKNWVRVKEKIKNSIRDIASDLYRLYIERKKEKGISFLPDDNWQKEFEESFIYQATRDQIKTIEEVKKDMVSTKIMDRLVCGDSGYGKTEVAMRASFKAVLSGKQVAILVPTTILALQHFFTFKERFADFPVNIGMLSRFIPGKKQSEILKGLNKGTVDILIGTHRILQNDIKLKNMGLLIIDEEQRFGVTHKEKIKAMFRKVDVLTLTATPIPRTLHLSLSGIRDISIIETPPSGRLSVVTYVGIHNDKIVREAIMREIERKGQVFYLHNFVYDIEKVKAKLQKLVPFAKVETAHGRMNEEQLADVMERFSSGNIDVLVATTIVENGLDIPRANTLIVDNTHRFGLADLYQLRGRVGRYKWKAYAYFLIPPHIYLTETMKERLKAIQELNKPGSGYKIALRDLEIRGAGNILGKQQHGFIEQVGFHLYCQFWKEVTGNLTGELQEIPEEVKFEGTIPPDYISSPVLRFWLYKKIAEAKKKEHLSQLLEEIKDRFGSVPEEVKKLILSRKIC